MKLRLNPSAAHTWTQCTAQPHYIQQFADKLPPNDTEYNREGTIAHTVVENTFSESPEGYKIKGFKPEMGRHAEGFVKFCRSLTKQPAKWWSEKKVPLFYAPASHGYIDYSSISKDGVVIADYKYGQGVAVTAEENLQMAIYAASLIAVECSDMALSTPVTMAIYQPRVRQGEPVTIWTLTYGELLQFVEEKIRLPALDVQDRKSLRFCSGPKVCQFCPAAGFCGLETMDWKNPATGKIEAISLKPNFPYTGKMRAEANLEDTPLEPIRRGLPARLMKPQELDISTLAKVVLKEKEIAKWLKDVTAYAESQLTSGQPIKGLKLVQGRGGHRVWRNEDDAKEMLLQHCERADVIVEKVITPTQAAQFEHDFPKDDWSQIQRLVHKPEGGPVLAAENDPRPHYGVSKAAEYFDDETQEVEDWV